ncbi:hypothetical protein P8C59_004758 [Phyllachora maydis]|uniref:Ribosomal RNA-processing protein 7 C-terminal domain-containing protein n=1 Tax=Phyllachora maydis TaxID=1825666 RepID=A0AAD9MES2_9PEZI|nr:hypothetical protein P8C59_004758 [Phyllachora maydis]
MAPTNSIIGGFHILPVPSTEYHLRALFASIVGAGRFESVKFEDDDDLKPLFTDASSPGQVSKKPAAGGGGKKRKRGEDNVQSAGRIQEVEAARLPNTWTRRLHRSGGTAVVVLADEKSAVQVLRAVKRLHRGTGSKRDNLPVWGGELVDGHVPPLGTAWLKAHNRLAYPDKTAVQAAVDAFFALYNNREREAADLAKRLRNEPDEDGFVTVTRGGRNAPAREAEAAEAKAKMLEKEEKKKKDMTNFYRFQLEDIIQGHVLRSSTGLGNKSKMWFISRRC